MLLSSIIIALFVVATQTVSTGTCHALGNCAGGGMSISANTFDDCCEDTSAMSFTSNGDGDLASGCYDCQDGG